MIWWSQRFFQPASCTPARAACQHRKCSQVVPICPSSSFLTGEATDHSLWVYLGTMQKTPVYNNRLSVTGEKHDRKTFYSPEWSTTGRGCREVHPERVWRGGRVFILGDAQTPMGHGPGKTWLLEVPSSLSFPETWIWPTPTTHTPTRLARLSAWSWYLYIKARESKTPHFFFRF